MTWKPFLLGAIFKIVGSQPLTEIPMKGVYSLIDMPRAARLLNVPFTMPERFPFLSVAAARACYWLGDRDEGQSRDLAKAVYHAAFGEGRDVSRAGAVVEIAEGLGVDGAALAAALQDPAVKDRLKAEVEAGIAKGVFGSPYVIVEGERFWGHDRLDHVDRWLATGGW